jgi:ribosomal protein L44E
MALPPWGFASSEEQTLSRRLTAKQGELKQVSRRIARIQDALTGQTRFDPEVHRLQLAGRRLEQADLRVQHLERQTAELQPCTVTIIGDAN